MLEAAKAIEAFITGSQAYGTANGDSDIDLVCYVSEQTKHQLVALAGGFPIRFGKLNLILVTNLGEVVAWKAAREAVIEQNAKLAMEGLPPLSKLEVCHIHADYSIPQRDGNPSASQESRDMATEYRRDLRERKRQDPN